MGNKVVALFVLISVILASCVSSSRPFSDAGKSVPDQSLYGTWTAPKSNRENSFWSSKKGNQAIAFLQPSEAKYYKGSPKVTMMFSLYVTDQLGRAFDAPGQAPVVISSFKDFGIINLIRIHDDGTLYDDEFFPAKYRVIGDRLEIWDPSPDAFALVIKNKQIKGEVTYNKENSQKIESVRLLDSSENLALLVQNDRSNKLFPESLKIVYTKLSSKTILPKEFVPTSTPAPTMTPRPLPTTTPKPLPTAILEEANLSENPIASFFVASDSGEQFLESYTPGGPHCLIVIGTYKFSSEEWALRDAFFEFTNSGIWISNPTLLISINGGSEVTYLPTQVNGQHAYPIDITSRENDLLFEYVPESKRNSTSTKQRWSPLLLRVGIRDGMLERLDNRGGLNFYLFKGTCPK